MGLLREALSIGTSEGTIGSQSGSLGYGHENTHQGWWVYLSDYEWFIWWAHKDLNLEPTDYESAALTN